MYGLEKCLAAKDTVKVDCTGGVMRFDKGLMELLSGESTELTGW